jgi:hypothetical protein
MDCFWVYPYAGVWLTPTNFHSLTVKPVIPVVKGLKLDKGGAGVCFQIQSGVLWSVERFYFVFGVAYGGFGWREIR